MGTKSKKSKLYQNGRKIFGVICIFISAMVTFFCAVIYGNVSHNWGKSILTEENFYNTPEFQQLFYTVLDDAIAVDVFYQNEKMIETGEKLNRDELIAGFKRYYGIVDGIITSNTKINDTYNGVIVDGMIPERLQANFEEYQNLVETRLPQYRQMYIQDQLDDYRNRVRSLESVQNFHYIVENADGKVVAGNTTRAEINQKTHNVRISAEFSNDNLGDKKQFAYSSPYMQNSPYSVYAAIDDPLTKQDAFYTLYQEFKLAKASIPYLFVTCSVAMFCFGVCLLYLLCVAGQKERHGKVTYLFVDKIYNEVHLILVLFAGICSFFIAYVLLDVILYRSVAFWSYVSTTLLGIVYMIDVAIGLSYVLSISRQIKGKIIFKNTLISVFLRRIARLMTDTTFRGWLVLVLLIYGMGNCILTFLICWFWVSRYLVVFFVLLVLYNVICLYLFLRALRSLKRIMISARETSQGNLAYQLDLSEISPSFLNFAEDIANIQEGLKKAVENAIKGERMKTELITNVSHDLKTPLTSIITYADLLKQHNLDDPVAREYVEVLHVKSYRLKQLIEDLIEASKVSTGNITVEKMRIDYRQLFMQAVGEMEEKITDAKLDLKLHAPEEVLIEADGRHMWRILENMLSNVVKYSMHASRVYVDIMVQEDFGVLIMKNVSATAIDLDPSHLAERFVRGDSARSTEGSGLGLSIAQSLAAAQGGSFEIQVDGDLFKAIVSIPLWKKDEIEEDTTQTSQEIE